VNIAIDYSVFSIYDSGQNKWYSKLIVGNPAGIINRREDLEAFIMNWLKIVAVVVVLVVVGVLFKKIANYKSAPEPRQKTPVDLNAAPGQQTVVAEQPRTFRQLTEEEEAGASQLFELAITQRKIGRMTRQYGAMVQYCREIIQKYPGSEYAYKAKRMLAAELPADKHEFYHITPDELDLSK
jgi:hypothetical protein